MQSLMVHAYYPSTRIALERPFPRAELSCYAYIDFVRGGHSALRPQSTASVLAGGARSPVGKPSGARRRSASAATPRLLWVGGRGGWLTERGVAAPRAGAGRPSSAPGGDCCRAAERASGRCFSTSLSPRLRPAVGMARGNQRELARQKNMKKTQEISKGKRKEDSLTTSQRKQRDSEIMQQKQKIANEKKSMQTREK
ncbi:small EDRK-rich factor 1 isoform X2 [Cricetulus griseus]|uniref:Small EDRK-rich factor 1 isoform X2 n=1 Tax=Cricetulus griseus TaxID=10029 RepID=A0A9J7FIH2_CRIGR|nr:small EDRK-rich factor 1 isoform X2 [Cricetulus griseus]